ncbi:disease resistance protein RPV1-like [Bidens hawaiensis]|uniref:disease resistance protein RPV1-like n=1 Tax=Bidens hawaiensis TaxID=980011 RepID=UPI0040496611
MKGLDLDDSFKLFSLYAFNRDHPHEPFIPLSKLVVDRSKGHPLALKILGSFLNGKTIYVWEDAMRKLDALPNPEIQKLLQLSYDTLDSNDKELFLHIACFFDGEDKEFIVNLLAECNLFPIVGIQNLTDRCLLDIVCGSVMMHNLIKEMGREVVRQESLKEPGKRSRLWNHQDSFDVLKENGGTKKVEGLALDMRMINGIDFSGRKHSYDDFSGLNKENFEIRALEKLKNLMLLQLDYAAFSGSYNKLPEKLRLLRWHGFPLKSIPSDVPLQKLVVLDLRYSKLKQVWEGCKLIKTPDFGGLPSLESLIFKGCLSLTEVCESVGCLERLVLLDISSCRSLKGVPCLPGSLKSLQMNDCPEIFRGGPGQVQCLDSCSLLVDIDVSACNLYDNSFPKDWSNLFSLKHLNINGNHITSLPGCVKSLPSLEQLKASHCSRLQSVVHLPKSLTNLQIINSKSLEVVQPTPNPFTNLSIWNCKKLCEVEGCYKFESIKKVESKVKRYLGLLENANKEEEEESIKVSYEFGIYSAFVSGKTVVPDYRYKEKGYHLESLHILA